MMGNPNVDKWADYDAWSQSEEADKAPFVVHVAGPDDVLPARDWREAVGIAHAVNMDIVEYTDRTENPGMVRSWATPYTDADFDYYSRAMLALNRMIPRRPTVAEVADERLDDLEGCEEWFDYLLRELEDLTDSLDEHVTISDVHEAIRSLTVRMRNGGRPESDVSEQTSDRIDPGRS